MRPKIQWFKTKDRIHKALRATSLSLSIMHRCNTLIIHPIITPTLTIRTGGTPMDIIAVMAIHGTTDTGTGMDTGRVTVMGTCMATVTITGMAMGTDKDMATARVTTMINGSADAC